MFCGFKLTVLPGHTLESPGDHTSAGAQPPEVLIQLIQGWVWASVLLGSSPVTVMCSEGQELLPWERVGSVGKAGTDLGQFSQARCEGSQLWSKK